MTAYNITLIEGVLRVGFGDPAQNDVIVQAAESRLDEMILSGELAGGGLIRVNGPASLPVAMVLAHKLGHRYSAVACFDPKMGSYVVSIAHGGQYSVGDQVQ